MLEFATSSADVAASSTAGQDLTPLVVSVVVALIAAAGVICGAYINRRALIAAEDRRADHARQAEDVRAQHALEAEDRRASAAIRAEDARHAHALAFETEKFTHRQVRSAYLRAEKQRQDMSAATSLLDPEDKETPDDEWRSRATEGHRLLRGSSYSLALIGTELRLLGDDAVQSSIGNAYLLAQELAWRTEPYLDGAKENPPSFNALTDAIIDLDQELERRLLPALRAALVLAPPDLS